MSQQTEAKREKMQRQTNHFCSYYNTEVNLDLKTDPSGGFFFSPNLLFHSVEHVLKTKRTSEFNG